MQHSWFMSLCLLVSTSTFLLVTAVAEDDSQDIQRIAKRYLRWEGKDIKPNSPLLPMIEVNYFAPHPDNDKAIDTADFTGFTIYQRNGMPNDPKDVGLFAFVSNDNVMKAFNEKTCSRPTRHAEAYYHIYKRCPEDDNAIIASGHCRVQGELRFNSATFNVNSHSYLNPDYYQNAMRSMNPLEQSLFKPCIEQWADSNYPLANWQCLISDAFAVTADDMELQVSNSTDFTCDACGDICAAHHVSLPVPVIVFTLLLTWVLG